MEISPAVPAPRAGDPITAKWAADLAAAVNSAANPADRVGEVSTPYGKASPAPGLPMLGKAKMPMPFDCAIFRDDANSADHLYIFLPDGGADYVINAGKVVPPAAAQTIGDSNTAWVDLGSITTGATRYVYLDFYLDSGGRVDGWLIDETSVPYDGTATGDDEKPPKILLASYNIAADATAPAPGTDNKFPSGKIGLVQYKHGTVVVGPRQEKLDTDENPGNPPGLSINRWQTAPLVPAPDAPLQLRQFHDVTDVLQVRPLNETGSGPDPSDVQILMRQTGGSGSTRPKLVYVDGSTGPFWVKGADATQNFGISIKIGDSQNGYITISAQ